MMQKRKLAIVVADSMATKLTSTRNPGAPFAATYAPIESTCPASCEQRKRGTCYAKKGRTALHERSLDVARPTEHASAEAAGIERLPTDGRPLRLHISGDARTVAAARILGRAVERWQARGGGKAWTYTHAFKNVPRASWGAAISVLASIDSIDDAAVAFAQGYAVARVVAYFPRRSDRAWYEGGWKWIPCPAQTRDVGCLDCKLCWKADWLRSRMTGIAFTTQGGGYAAATT